MSNEGTCRSCKAAVYWVKLDSGRNMPVDRTKQSEPRASLVCFNPATGRGKVLRNDDIDAAYRWIRAGATLHRSHFMTCPEARKHREEAKRSKEQDQAQGELERVTAKFPELDH